MEIDEDNPLIESLDRGFLTDLNKYLRAHPEAADYT